MTRERYVAALWGILGGGVLLRVAVLLWVPTQPVSDFYGFYRVAQNLAATGRYETSPGHPDFGRSPAYPTLLAGALWLAPPDRALAAAKAVNVALAALAAFVGATLARGLWGEAAGLWAAGLVGLLPRPVLMTDLLAAENLIAPLWLSLLLLCAVSWIRGFRPRVAAGIGILAGLLCLTRAVLYGAPLIWVAGALAARRPWRIVLREGLLIIVVQHAVLLPWALRNARDLGHFTPFNLVGGIGLFVGNNAESRGEWYPWPAHLERLRPGVLARGPVAVDEAAGQEAWRWIRENPGRAAALYARRLRIVASDDGFVAAFAVFADAIPAPSEPKPVLPGPHPLKDHARGLRLGLRASGVLLAICGAAGFVLLLRSARCGSSTDRALGAGFAAAVLYVPLVSAAMHVNGRYRWAAEDALVPLAGLALAYLFGRSRKPGRQLA